MGPAKEELLETKRQNDSTVHKLKETVKTPEVKEDELLFLGSKPGVIPIYEALTAKLFAAYPDTKIKVSKSQISFYNRHLYACVSFARVKKKKELPENWFVLTLGLNDPLESPRVAVKTEPYPGRWTTHIVIGSVEELDEELFGWIGQAYDFAQNK